MGHLSLNDSDDEDNGDRNFDDSSAKSSTKAFKGTNLSMTSERRPATKKRKRELLSNAINGLARCQERGFDSLSQAITTLAGEEEKEKGHELNNRVNEIEKNW